MAEAPVQGRRGVNVEARGALAHQTHVIQRGADQTDHLADHVLADDECDKDSNSLQAAAVTISYQYKQVFFGRFGLQFETSSLRALAQRMIVFAFEALLHFSLKDFIHNQ